MLSYFESLVNPYPDDTPSRAPGSLLAFYWHYTRPVWKILALNTVAVVVLSLVEVSLFAFMGNVVDWLSNANRETFLADEGWNLAWMAFVAIILIPLLGLAHSLFQYQGLMGNYGMIVRWRMHRYLLRQSLGFYADEFAGRVATKVMQTSLAVRDSVLTLLSVMVFVGVYFTGGMVLVGAFHWLLAVPFLLWLIAYGFVLNYFLPRMSDVSRRQADARSLMTGRIVDSYTNITTVKLFAHAEREEAYAKDAMDGFLQTVHPQMRLSTWFELWVQFLSGLLLVGAGGAGIWLWMQGQATVGGVAIAIALVLRLNGMAHWIMWELARFFEALGVVRDGMKMMSQNLAVTDREDAKTLDARGKDIFFDDIRFSYGADNRVMDGLKLRIANGEKVGLVGRSGAGKTTLTNILLRFYDVEAGVVRIGDLDISHVTQNSLRENIGMVTQDTSLLHRSIRENIAYSRPHASDEEIIAAAKKANAWSFIETLVDNDGRKGLDAQVGERGVKLSGGQRQRIAIARIFLKDAPILVLDEATSALDSEVEAAIQESLFELMKGKTVIAIAHRLSTISQLDRLIVMDEGRIIETGTHQELVAQKGVYSDLWKRQSGGFLATDDSETVDAVA
ncbi:MAG: ABC transporter ATP-binding protein [Pseudomonadota bacterium]